jgi:hypothetical protein
VVDLSVLVGVAGTLGGVAVGSLLSDRSQRALLRENQRQASARAREDAYVEFLAVFRSFRSFLMGEPVNVKVIHRPDGGVTTVIEGAAKLWESVASARARVHILAGVDSPVYIAAEKVKDALTLVAAAREGHGPGEIPTETLDVLRHAELEFAAKAQLDITNVGQ